MLDNFRKIDLVWNNAYEKLGNVRTAQFDEKGRKLVVQVTNGGDIIDLTGTELKLVTIDGIEIGGRNLAYPIHDTYRAYGGSVTSTVIQKVSGSVYRTYLVKVEEGQTYIATQKGVGQNVRYFWFENNPIENLNSEVSIGGGYHEPNTLNVPLTPPAGANWIFVVATINNDTHPVSEIKFEKGTKATDWTPAPEDLQFPFDLIDAQKGIYELYFPKLFVDRYTGDTKVFLELTTKDFSVTSEPFYINVFEGVR